MYSQYFERMNNCWTKVTDKSEEKHVHGTEKRTNNESNVFDRKPLFPPKMAIETCETP